ncbi:hypothetical protein AVEN_111657-1 [Araneus ventricosus]|uniref:Uncharacterized protein n=1 Tax=Araneus ventricosus TaxID=182803 RepID=A0A4Y2C357_ARAVE|nr:hypothetical protein AVEN_111657-1 [Araneus ventricosus]
MACWHSTFQFSSHPLGWSFNEAPCKHTTDLVFSGVYCASSVMKTETPHPTLKGASLPFPAYSFTFCGFQLLARESRSPSPRTYFSLVTSKWISDEDEIKLSDHTTLVSLDFSMTTGFGATR